MKRVRENGNFLDRIPLKRVVSRLYEYIMVDMRSDLDQKLVTNW